MKRVYALPRGDSSLEAASPRTWRRQSSFDKLRMRPLAGSLRSIALPLRPTLVPGEAEAWQIERRFHG